MKRNYLKVLFWSFSLMFVLFSCEKDPIEDEISTTQNQRPGKQMNFITTEDAKDVAISFLNQVKSDDRSEIAKDDIKEVQTIVNDEETPIMYAVNLNKGNGFVVISASFVECPILAYSEKGNFDFETIGDYNGVVDWAYTTYLTINQRIEKEEEPDDEVTDLWETFGYQAKTSYQSEYYICPQCFEFPPDPKIVGIFTIIKGPLLTTEWDQRFSGNPNETVIGYNNFVRFKNCSQGISPAGCVAVAMGQIMKYHNYPNIYNINTMPNDVDSDNHTGQNAINIARFLQHIGTKVNMNYSCHDSGASSQKARSAFVNNYMYKASNLVSTSYFLIEQSLEKNRPVYLEGCKNRIITTIRLKPDIFTWAVESPNYTYSSCHAWVVDGFQRIQITNVYPNGYMQIYYSSNGLVHCNWGLGGNPNGWFYYTTWKNEQNIDKNVGYVYAQHMIHDIRPWND